MNATDNRIKEEALERHKQSLKNHIDTLAKKNYQGIKSIKTIDTVIMFCPNESAISILPRQGGSKLFEYAIKNKITLASPSIFYYMLKTAEYSWKADKQNKNVSDVIQLANLVSTQAVDIYGSAKKAQEAIANTSEKVSEIMGKIKDGSGSFLSRIQRMNKLGLSPKKQIPIEVEDDDVPSFTSSDEAADQDSQDVEDKKPADVKKAPKKQAKASKDSVKPVADKKPSAGKEPLADKKPSAVKKPAADK